MKYIPLLIYLVVGTSLVEAKPKDNEEEKSIIGHAVKLTKDYDWQIGTYEGVSSNYWTVSEEMIETIHPVLINHLKTTRKEKVYNHLELYRCQYFGIVVNGNYQIYCSFFKYSKEYADWRKAKHPILQSVMDVGWDYFYFVYDINEGKCKVVMHRGP